MSETKNGRVLEGKGFQPKFEMGYLAPKYWFDWILIGSLGLCVLLPRRLALWIGARLGDSFYRLNPKRRRIADINFKLCFPDLSASDRANLVRRHFRVYGQSVIDLGLIRWASEARLRRLVHVRGEQAFVKLLEHGDPVMLITPHAVGMDFGGVMLSRVRPTISMMKPLNSPLLDWFIARCRTRYGATLILRDQGLRLLIQGLKQGQLCYHMPDEDFGAKHSVFVSFFGVPAATITTVGRMAAITGAKVVPCFTRLVEDNGDYEVVVQPALSNFPTGDRVVDAKRMNEALEELIKIAPEQYMWTLRWFKTRPDGAPAPY